MTALVVYKGDLRCESEHLQSGSVIETDAPTDNKGKGEKFSPTDCLCMSLATCMITTMAIKAQDMDIDLTGSKVEVSKFMFSEPRRIGKVEVRLFMKYVPELSEDQKALLQRAGDNCPVMKSLHPELEVSAEYVWE
ncbi:MAG: OsmC family protein [Ferruginibacter sp.]